MKTIFDHIEYAKGKPHHIRKRIAFGIAGGVTAIIALMWFIGSLSLGAFAIKGSTFADSTGQQSVVVASGDENNSADNGIAGVASAIPNASEPARIEIIDTATSSSAGNTAEQTTIPF